jgi:hypothetical protein
MTHPVGSQPELLAVVDVVLSSANSKRIPTDALEDWGVLAAAYEDPHSFVGVAYFPSLSGLIAGWLDAQERLGRLASTVTQLGAKAWDGYLVLLCDQSSSPDTAAEVTAIRSNTRRLRKLVITGDDLMQGDQPIPPVVAVRRALAPLLPIDVPPDSGFVDPVSTLSARITVPGLEASDIDVVVEAHELGLPMVAALHERLRHRSGRS